MQGRVVLCDRVLTVQRYYVRVGFRIAEYVSAYYDRDEVDSNTKPSVVKVLERWIWNRKGPGCDTLSVYLST